MYPLVCISFSRYSRIFSLSNPYPRSNAARVSLSRPCVLPSLSPLIVFLGSCLLPFPPSLAIHPHLPPLISLSLSLHALPTTPLRTYANAAAVIVGTATRARILLLVFFPRENVCVRMGERARAATHTKGTLLRTMRYVHARARARDSSLVRATVYRSCAVQRELRKGGGGVLRVNSIPRVALQVPFDTQA